MAEFREIAEEIVSLHERKNADYGNAFGRSFEKWGLVTALIRLGDKMNRLESLYRNGTAKVDDESVRDTLVDLAAYAMMTIEELDRDETEKLFADICC